MKKILLKESQVKYIIDKLMDTTISEQMDPESERALRKMNKATKQAQRKPSRGPSDWGGGDQGTFNFLSIPYGAVNVSEDNLKISRQNRAIKDVKAIPGKQTPPQETPPQKQEPVLSTFTVQGSSLPYVDNMVKPYFDKYPDALGTFNEILRRFVEYIKNGGGPNLTNVTIKGSADSATPTTDVPAGYSKLDHPSAKPYNGLTDPRERNQYLADTRASEYARVLSARIKELTGFDLNIKVLPGDNYYGQPGKRGVEFRSIVLTPNADELKKVDQPASETPGTVTPATSEPGQDVKNTKIPYEIAVHINDEDGYYVDGYSITENNGTNWFAIPYQDAVEMEVPMFTGITEARIENNNLYIGDKLIGKNQRKRNLNLYFSTEETTDAVGFVGPITVIYDTRKHDIEGVGKIDLAYLQDTYFLFHV
jgi:hypothetical protein